MVRSSSISGSTSVDNPLVQIQTSRRVHHDIFVGDTHVGGCDELYALDQKGELDPLLGITSQQ